MVAPPMPRRPAAPGRRRPDRRQLSLAFEALLLAPPPARPGEPERLGDVLARLLAARGVGPGRHFARNARRA